MKSHLQPSTNKVAFFALFRPRAVDGMRPLHPSTKDASSPCPGEAGSSGGLSFRGAHSLATTFQAGGKDRRGGCVRAERQAAHQGPPNPTPGHSCRARSGRAPTPHPTVSPLERRGPTPLKRRSPYLGCGAPAGSLALSGADPRASRQQVTHPSPTTKVGSWDLSSSASFPKVSEPRCRRPTSLGRS